jgi:hypothetical protein
MNDTTASSAKGRSHAATTAGGCVLLAIAILYVASWPVIEIKTGTDGVFYDIDRSGYILFKPTPWANVLYRPLHWLANATSPHNDPFITADSSLLVRYWFWWKEELRVRGLPAWRLALPREP